MSVKKYRACLIGLLAIVLMIGATLYIKNRSSNEIPAEGTLVQNDAGRQAGRDGGMDWAQEMRYYI